VEFRYQGYPAGQHSFSATTYVDALYRKGKNTFELELLTQFSYGAITLPSFDIMPIDAAETKLVDIASIAPTNRITNILFIVFFPPLTLPLAK
jgi:hypothetical protein